MTYPDTEQGARSLLRDLRPQVCDGWGIDAAMITADPWIAGCWLATWPDGHKTVVFVHPHPSAPNFEEIDSDSLRPDQ